MFEKVSTYNISKTSERKSYLKRLELCLSDNLNFHNENSNYLSHNFHAFPAKFPPQLPKKFIMELTQENDIVLDPMMGSGTTILEAISNNRNAVGFDIDPLALMITSVKTTCYNKKTLVEEFNRIITYTNKLLNNQDNLTSLFNKFDPDTKSFVEYWFHKETIKELLSLSYSISKIENEKIKNFFRIIFSSIIITKSGGVSLAMDLAHTRPHRAKNIIDPYSESFFKLEEIKEEQKSYTTKKLKSSLGEFKKKFYQNLESVREGNKNYKPVLTLANSQNSNLGNNSIDLIVTSPPYPANAIDYMRAHKFSLLWFGYTVEDLKDKRKEYIGHEAASSFSFEEMPPLTKSIISKVAQKNIKKSQSLHRYYSEMKSVLKEMYRVLKHNTSAIVVVGNSNICGVDSRTDICLKEIGENLGFIVPKIGERDLDRNRRMMPASNNKNYNSQILNRMHKEYIIGFYKQ